MSEQRTLLVLGASRYQLEVILAGKRLGMRVATTDNVPENPGHRLADVAFSVDTTDAEGVLALARELGVAGVIAPCTDVAVTTAAKVGHALGLRHVPPPSAAILTSKIRFRRWTTEAKLPSPAFEILRGAADVTPFERPRVVKPEGSSGSKGIFVVRNDADLASRLPETLSFSRTREALVEDLVPGRQGTCEGLVLDGDLAFASITDRETVAPPHVATSAHFVPSRFTPSERSRILGAVGFVLDALGIDDAPFDADFVLGDDGEVHLLELTPRLGGNALTRLVRSATDVDLADAAVRLACGEALSLADLRAVLERPTAQLVLGVSRPGALVWDEAEALALGHEPWVRDLVFDVPRGSPVLAFVNGRTRVGEVTVTASSRDELDERVTALRRRLALDAS